MTNNKENESTRTTKLADIHRRNNYTDNELKKDLMFWDPFANLNFPESSYKKPEQRRTLTIS